ncbi:uracil-DNA glycosylase [Micrococcus terreus]|uniref:uracil-DNA glycosylase n=1 Tax=Micrococcus terreus TaxID=574650 RepID=UPI00255057A1|nr:uracil-DNA glycosylase [Micrococcus terreus]MDK7701915.1 uracil-DNA glycosylase [Micrococcus terreus]WOO97473.1 uracil-DNA glycosylase [Micrococcus terreus]
MYAPHPRSLADLSELARRRALLTTKESAQPLRVWREELMARRRLVQPDGIVPDFDPAEAGTAAQVLTVLESPGPMTDVNNRRPGSGFVSVDNDDATAANCWWLRNETGLHDDVLLWNIVPWYLHAVRRPTASELAQGSVELRRLLQDQLRDVRVVLTLGRTAQRGWQRHIEPNLDSRVLSIPTWHTSPLAFNQPGKRDELLQAFDRAARLVSH